MPKDFRRLAALRLMAVAILLAPLPGITADAIVTVGIEPSAYPRAREALTEAIEEEGLIPAPPSAFGNMLARTGPDLGRPASPYGQAEVLHFCSATIAWKLVEEDPAHIAQCPLSIAIYTLRGNDRRVFLAYRRPNTGTPGGDAAEALLQRIARRTAESARQ
ncbi:MAG: DUF302 domain-containing protein [Zoogloea sp.]|nr:DUF302 domain-containing protein [Zoogloea sp.]